jgi:AmiR/NasT family two-component response regulator
MANGTTLDVVVLDGTPEARREVYAALRLAGIARIRLATSIEHARALACACRPDVIVVDIGVQRRERLSLDAVVRQLNPVDEAKADEPDAASKYGLDTSSVSGFAGDLDELLGDGPAGGGGSSGGGAPIPIMLSCDKPTMSVVELAKSSGITGILVKPFEPKVTAARLKAAASVGKDPFAAFRAA